MSSLTQNQIFDMARQAGIAGWEIVGMKGELKAFAKLVAAQEREECAKVLREAREALQFANDTPNGAVTDTIWMMHRPETLFDFMDEAIRARSKA